MIKLRARIIACLEEVERLRITGTRLHSAATFLFAVLWSRGTKLNSDGRTSIKRALSLVRDKEQELAEAEIARECSGAAGGKDVLATRGSRMISAACSALYSNRLVIVGFSPQVHFMSSTHHSSLWYALIVSLRCCCLRSAID